MPSHEPFKVALTCRLVGLSEELAHHIVEHVDPTVTVPDGRPVNIVPCFGPDGVKQQDDFNEAIRSADAYVAILTSDFFNDEHKYCSEELKVAMDCGGLPLLFYTSDKDLFGAVSNPDAVEVWEQFKARSERNNRYFVFDKIGEEWVILDDGAEARSRQTVHDHLVKWLRSEAKKALGSAYEAGGGQGEWSQLLQARSAAVDGSELEHPAWLASVSMPAEMPVTERRLVVDLLFDRLERNPEQAQEWFKKVLSIYDSDRSGY